MGNLYETIIVYLRIFLLLLIGFMNIVFNKQMAKGWIQSEIWLWKHLKNENFVKHCKTRRFFIFIRIVSYLLGFFALGLGIKSLINA